MTGSLGELLGGAALLILGLVLLTHEHEEFGLFCLAFGAFFLWRGLRNSRRRATAERHLNSAAGHHAEIWSRAEQGEDPEQIIQSFETQYGIPPVQTLEYIAGTALLNVGRGQDSEKTQALLGWLASGRPEPLPSPVDVIEHLDPARNLFGVANGVLRHPGPNQVVAPIKGALLATRTHLMFLPYPVEDELGQEMAKERIIHQLPPVFQIGALAHTMVEVVQAELAKWSDPKLIQDLKHRLSVAGGLAVPWRELTGVGKDVVTGAGFERVHMVLLHGNRDTPDELRLAHGTGFDEAWVDNWIDVTRSAAILEGLLLFV